jgi:N-acetyl sugar amidotransferase
MTNETSRFGNSFRYDILLSLNASLKLREKYESIANQFEDKSILAVTFNHRFFQLQEKNRIKAYTDAHQLDHIMFSMRPSARALIAGLSDDDIQQFTDLSQIVFVLQMMGRYDIRSAIVDSKNLNVGDQKTVEVKDIAQVIIRFLEELKDKLPETLNFAKQFPWLSSVSEILPKIQNHSLYLLDAIESNLPRAHYNDQQINELEKDLFWLGFDPDFKQVPHDKEYPITRWTELSKKSQQGKGLFEQEMRYCARCCLPETMEGIELDEIGICVPCRSSEQKMHIDWEQRRAILDSIIDSYRSENYYDCMLPMSGGKDSTYQAYLLDKVIGVTSLAVTHGQNWGSLEGRYNLENCLQKFDLDHLIFFKNRAVINKVARKSLEEIGDACWHCHIGNGTFAIQAALAWNVGLMLWGESVAEVDGRGSYAEQAEASLVYNLDISARIPAQDMTDELTPQCEMSSWYYPPEGELKQSDIKYIHLGDYFFWDEERQFEFVKRNYEWMDSRVENTFKGYKSVECVMAGVHDYSNFIKRGIGRATMHAAEDVRRGILTREEGMELAKEYDSQRPHALDYYLKITGLTEEEYEATLIETRKKSEYAIRLKYK